MRTASAVAFAAVLASAAGVASVATSACTIKTTPADDDGGSDASTVETIGSQCSAIGTAVCQAFPMCAIAMSTSLSDCISSYVATCCTGSTCNELSQTSATELQACLSAYQPPDCNLLANATVPSVCNGIPQQP